MKAKLEPYLGFLHSIAKGKPSLICDSMESDRYLIDDFVIQICIKLKKKDFTVKSEDYSSNRKGKRQYLNEEKSRDLLHRLNKYFEKKVAIPRMRRGAHQGVETLISEETLLFAEYLRDEKPTWDPRIVALP
jgi:CRISPR/Cas system-associated endonuclease Cas1